MAWKGTFLPLPQIVAFFAKILAPLLKKTKLGTKTMDCIFIGHDLIAVLINFWYIN